MRTSELWSSGEARQAWLSAITSCNGRLPFVILDDNDRIGDAWRKRWDSLRLFTPGRYRRTAGHALSGIALLVSDQGRGRRLSGGLCAHVRAPCPNRGQSRETDQGRRSRFEVICGEDTLLADNVVVATGAYNNPRVPPFARELDESIRPAPLQGIPQPFPNPEGECAGRRRWQLRRGDSHRARSPPPDMAFGPGHGAGAHAGRESSRSPVHAHHVVRGDAIDREHAVGKKAPRPLSRPSSWNPAGAGATEGLCRRGDRKSAANDGGEQRTSRSRERKGPQRCRM